MQTSPSRQTHSSIIWLAILNFLLTLSTFFTPSPGVFFAFILFNGASQAVVGAYLQTSVIAVASLFGPLAVQAMMSGQAAVAVAVSGVQVISAAASVRGKTRVYASDGSAEERSAFIFFSLSTLFLIASAVAHSWMIKTPVYQQVAASLERGRKKTVGEIGLADERESLVTGSANVSPAEDRANAFRVGRANITYEVAVAYVFIVTLVCLDLSLNFFFLFFAKRCGRSRLSTLPSQHPFNPQILQHILCFSAHYISSFLTSETFWAGTFARSPSSSYGVPAVF